MLTLLIRIITSSCDLNVGIYSSAKRISVYVFGNAAGSLGCQIVDRVLISTGVGNRMHKHLFRGRSIIREHISCYLTGYAVLGYSGIQWGIFTRLPSPSVSRIATFNWVLYLLFPLQILNDISSLQWATTPTGSVLFFHAFCHTFNYSFTLLSQKNFRLPPDPFPFSLFLKSGSKCWNAIVEE